jgi:hypothetical protein
MPPRLPHTFATISLAVISLAASFAPGAEVSIPEKPEYNRDVRPILADACFRCHGFDKNTRDGGRRLDLREGALSENDGIRAIVPGKLEDSDLHTRIHSSDRDEIMPPPKANKQLSAREKAILDRWIEQGAEYQEHWAYIAPKRPTPPTAANPDGKSSSGNSADAFILARQQQLGLKRVGEADRATLYRRLSFDLLGLPPKPEEVGAFVNDKSPDAYEKLVDRLLASPHYGERMAVWWLDLVRYADSIGYHSDNPRNVWPYRDYVIRAFNDDMHFDRFTIEQVAGDLLPNPTQAQKVASAYNRLILTTEEGGAQPKQYEAKYVTDRVKSIGTTWLAQTYMCAECHDHKYDPFTTRDFYALGAFFGDIKEDSVGRREPGMLAPSPEQEATMKENDARVAALQMKLDTNTPELEAAQREWEKANTPRNENWKALHPTSASGENAAKLTVVEDQSITPESNPISDTYKVELVLPAGTTAVRLDVLANKGLPAGGPGRASNGNFVLSEFQIEHDNNPLKISTATATFEQPEFGANLTIDGKKGAGDKGWAVHGNIGKDASAYFELAEPIVQDTPVVVLMSQNAGGNHTIGKFRLSATNDAKPIRAPFSKVPADIASILKTPREQRDAKMLQKLAAHFRGIAPQLDPVRKDFAEAKKVREAFINSIGRCLVSESMPTPRKVRVLPRGDWMNESGDVMQPATPGYLPGAPKPAEGKRLTRLDLANWLISRQNPLTARVFVNRLWKLFYGMGLSKTVDDLGTQGELPANQALLDWLACEFMDSGWDVKHMVRLMVTSSSYRLASTATKEMLAQDPFNREMARGGRWRLDAEFVRDNALTISGLITHQVGGPSVKPYQPAGYWENLNFPAREWDNDKDRNQWRRGLYTWWQRSYLQPSLLAFDASTREECTSDRPRSNIPQQALALLNDPTYVEASRAFATRIIREGGASISDKCGWAFRQATGRTASEDERQVLTGLYDQHLAQYTQDLDAAKKFIATGYTPVPTGIAPAELAAWTSVARAILNLHETITRL